MGLFDDDDDIIDDLFIMDMFDEDEKKKKKDKDQNNDKDKDKKKGLFGLF